MLVNMYTLKIMHEYAEKFGALISRLWKWAAGLITFWLRVSLCLFLFYQNLRKYRLFERGYPKKNTLGGTFFKTNINWPPNEIFELFQCPTQPSGYWFGDGHRNFWFLTLFVPVAAVQRGYPSSHFYQFWVFILISLEQSNFWPKTVQNEQF